MTDLYALFLKRFNGKDYKNKEDFIHDLKSFHADIEFELNKILIWAIKDIDYCAERFCVYIREDKNGK